MTPPPTTHPSADHENCASCVAIAQLNGDITSLKGDVAEMVRIQQSMAEDIAESSRKSTDQIHALAIEIERQKTGSALSTGDQRTALERLNAERREGDMEMRGKIGRYETERNAMLSEVNKANASLVSILKQLADGDKRIQRGEQAYAILKWVGIVVGALLLTTLVARVLLAGGGPIVPPVKIDNHEMTISIVGATSMVVAKIWASAVSLAGMALMTFKAIAFLRFKLHGG